MALKYCLTFLIIFYCLINSPGLISGQKCTETDGVDELKKLLEDTKDALQRTDTVLQQLSTIKRKKPCNETTPIVEPALDSFENLIGTPWQKCVTCMCYAKTHCTNISTCIGVSDRKNCANSISESYWKIAKSPTINAHMGEQQSFKSCMKDENCLLNTVKRYTESFGEKDCNNDGKFDCYDKLLIHLNGENCSKYYGDLAKQYNSFYYCDSRYGKKPLK